jgi:hypothetical protein
MPMPRSIPESNCSWGQCSRRPSRSTVRG